MKTLGLTVAAVLLSVSTLWGANLAADNSGDVAYDDAFPQWDTGDNGGTGFGAWTLSPDPNSGTAGFFTGSATQNGTGGSSGGAINVGGDSWGLYANGGATAVAYRPLTGSSLSAGQTFSIDMDNGWNDGVVGFVLRNGNNTTDKNAGQRLEFLHFGGQGNYWIVTNAGSAVIDTGVAWTDGGLHIDVELLSLDLASVRIIRLDNAVTNTLSVALGGTLGSGIDSVALYNQYAGSGQNYDLFFNSMSIVPEPSTLVLALAGLAGVWMIRRR